MRFCDADSADCHGSDYFVIRVGTVHADGVDGAVLWGYLPFARVYCMVRYWRFSIFTMGKLTQSQKALFLWRSPLAKMR
jgi:hypothetical protein